MTTTEAFDTWWQAEGQFCRAGGGDYEKTFAFRAYDAETERAAILCEVEAGRASFVGNHGASLAAEQCAAAIRARDEGVRG